ncbi:MAG: 2-oxoacid:ferredoxin oxidoreductase subunit beta [Caldisericia bacterium]
MTYKDYLDYSKLPTIFCPGCGLGIGLRAILQTFSDLNLKKEDIIFVSGIGCSSRIPGYVDFDSLHTLHGRAIPFATGVKLSHPEKNVIVITGDGDGLSIGGNHMIHAARRNINIKVFLFNNMTYGMTGGQASPTTPLKKITSTTPYGKYDSDFDSVELLKGAGAGFIARGTVYHYNMLLKVVKESLIYKGFSFVEIITPCPTYYGRLQGIEDPAKFFIKLKDFVYSIDQKDVLKEEEKKDKLPIGIFKNERRETFEDIYFKIVEDLKTK